MKLAPLTTGLLLSSTQLWAREFLNATLQQLLLTCRSALQEMPALRQLAVLSEESVYIYISGDHARWN